MDDNAMAVQQEKAGWSEQDRYFKLAFYVKISSIALKQGEELPSEEDATNVKTLEVLKKVVDHCGIQGFSYDQVDVCHRIGKDVFSPIIIKFNKKNDRVRFFKQKSKLRNMNTSLIGLPLTKEQKSAILSPSSSTPTRGTSSGLLPGGGGRGGAKFRAGSANNYLVGSDGNIKLPFVSFFESLINFNAELLKEAKALAKSLNYKYPGYTVDRGVRVKMHEGGTFITIK